MRFNLLIIMTIACAQITTAQPELLWYRIYGETIGYYEAESVINVGENGFLIVGSYFYNIFPGGYTKGFIARTGTSGAVIWASLYSEEQNQSLYDCIQMDSESYLAVGEIRSDSSVESRIWLLKINDAGEVLWSRTIGTGVNEVGRAIKPSDDGNYLIAGLCEPGDNPEGLIAKIDPEGNQLWLQTYGGVGDQEFYDIIPASDGGYVAVGICDTIYNNSDDVYLVKVDEMGNELWTQIHGENNYDFAYSIEETPDGGYILAGTTSRETSEYYDCLLLRTDSEGNELWSQLYDHQGTLSGDFGRDVLLLDDGGFLLLGSTGGYYYNSTDILLIRTDELGDELWMQEYDIEGTCFGNSLIAADTGGYIVAGSCSDDGFPTASSEALLMRFSEDPVSVNQEIETSIPVMIQFNIPYPNPFNPTTVFSFEMPDASCVSLGVLDISGRLVATLVNGWQEAGRQEVTFDGADLPSGIYIYRLTAREFEASGKMVLLK